MPDQDVDLFLVLSSQIVSAYVAKNQVSHEALPDLIRDVRVALAHAVEPPEPSEEPPVPAVNPKRSAFKDHIICLEDGLKMKMLRRHLRTAHDMSPDEYRQRWNLPADYPMTAPAYAAMRSDLAKDIGLGRKPAVAAGPTDDSSAASRPATKAAAEAAADSPVGAAAEALVDTPTPQEADNGRQKNRGSRARTGRAAPLKRRSPKAKR